VKRPTMLVKAMLAQASIDLNLSVERDAEVIQHRCEHEGLSFLTITLPLLATALERGIEEGRLSCPTNYSRHGSLPRLLGGFFSRVFARDGRVLQDPDVDCIFYIRQICNFFKKLKMPCTASREADAIASYLAIEEDLRSMTSQIQRNDVVLDDVSSLIWSQVFPEIDPEEIICSHGPGVTAERFLSNERKHIRYWYDRMEHTFPSDLHAFPNFGYACEAAERGSANSLEYLGLGFEKPVRVVFVPKTQSSPRVIAIEPSTVQYVQQGLMSYCVPRLETHRLTRRSIRFRDQTYNQRLALRSSIDRKFATIDLKDASDRVHLGLVQRIFRSSGLLEYLEDSRSLHAVLPNGVNILLNKFASMGSAMCFPTEAMVFYTLIQSCFHRLDSRRPSSKSVEFYSKQIAVYGDDIIIPVSKTDATIEYLQSYGLKVNVNKSFRTSLFRESCGGDYYNGHSVKPVYARQLPPDTQSAWSAETVMAWTSTANQLYSEGLWHVAQVIRSMLERVLHSRIPRTRSSGPGIAFSSLLYDTDLRYNRHLCSYEQRRIQYLPTTRKDDIDGNANACLQFWGQTTYEGNCRDSDRFTRREFGNFPHNAVRSENRYGSPELSQESLQRLFGYISAAGQGSVLGLPVVYSLSSRKDSRGDLDSRKSLDFRTSVKRGVFKLKRRWTTTYS